MGLTLINGRPSGIRGEATVLREAITSVQRAIEDIGWQDLSQDRLMTDGLAYEERKVLVERSRIYVRKNPLGKQAASLLVNYVLGKGIALTARNKTLVARILDEFWENKTVAAAFAGHQAMSDFLVGAFTDGIQALILFPDEDEGTVELGYLDSLYIEDIITDPDNARVPLWVKVRKPRLGYDFRNGVYVPHTSDEFVWYRHWQNVPDEDEDEKKDKDKAEPKGRSKLAEAARESYSIRRGPSRVEPGLIYIAKRGRGKFGFPETAPALDWLLAHKHFMEDRATLSRAAAAVAWKKKRKNSSPTDIASEVARLRSTLATSALSPGWDANPPPAAGSTHVENESSTLEWVKTDTGGANALADERILRMMAGSGMGGIPNHYFGDEANANLATATAMELPLLKAYENWQQWLTDVIKDLISFVLETAHKAGRIGPDDRSNRYAERSLSAEQTLAPGGGSSPPPGAPTRGIGQAPPPGGARYPVGAPARNPQTGQSRIGEAASPIRVAPPRLADSPELKSREAFWAAGNIDPKKAPAKAAQEFDDLPVDAYVWVFHATKEDTKPFMNEGLRPENAPQSIAKEFVDRQPKGKMVGPDGKVMVGPDGMEAEDPGFEVPKFTGTSVTGTLPNAHTFGPNVLAMRVRVGDLQLRPESEKNGLTVGEVLVGQDGATVEKVSPFDMVEVKGKDAYTAIKAAVAKDARLKEAESEEHFYGPWSGGSKAAGGHPAKGIEQARAQTAARVGAEAAAPLGEKADPLGYAVEEWASRQDYDNKAMEQSAVFKPDGTLVKAIGPNEKTPEQIEKWAGTAGPDYAQAAHVPHDLWAGNVVVHNHPGHDTAFSPEDLNMGQVWKPAEMRVASVGRNYVLKPGPKGWYGGPNTVQQPERNREIQSLYWNASDTWMSKNMPRIGEPGKAPEDWMHQASMAGAQAVAERFGWSITSTERG